MKKKKPSLKLIEKRLKKTGDEIHETYANIELIGQILDELEEQQQANIKKPDNKDASNSPENNEQ